MPAIGITLADRNTKSLTLRIGYYEFLVSYETIVGVACMEGRFKVPNRWGPTTGRHMNDFFGDRARVISEEEMRMFVHRAIVETAGDLVEDKLRGPNERSAY